MTGDNDVCVRPREAECVHYTCAGLLGKERGQRCRKERGTLFEMNLPFLMLVMNLKDINGLSQINMQLLIV